MCLISRKRSTLLLFLEGSGAWFFSNCNETEDTEIATKVGSDSHEDEEMANIPNKKKKTEQGDKIRIVKYNHLAHFGILFVRMLALIPIAVY